MIDYTLILTRKFPNTEWSLIGEDYENLLWFSNTPKPTKDELENLWDEVKELIEEEKQNKVNAKAAAEAKLAALGLNSDDFKALGLV
jgi:hypothetical protein